MLTVDLCKRERERDTDEYRNKRKTREEKAQNRTVFYAANSRPYKRTHTIGMLNVHLYAASDNAKNAEVHNET